MTESHTSPRESDRLNEILEQVNRHAVRLLGQTPAMPRRVRVQAADVSVELEWPVATDVAVAAGPQPGAPGLPAVTPQALGPAVGAGAQVAAESPDEGHLSLGAPVVGVFYRCPEPGAKPFVEEGDLVQPGQQVGIVEAMKLMVPVEADTHGRVVEVLVADGVAVEYQQSLFTIAPIEPE